MTAGARTTDAVLLADVGNTRIKLAVVEDHGDGADGRRLPRIARRQDLMSRDFRPTNLEAWLAGVAPGPAVLLVASVHEAAAVRLEAAVAEVSATRHRAVRQRRIGHADLPLTVLVDEPHRVGIDRVAAAAAGGEHGRGPPPPGAGSCPPPGYGP
jgi:pantothenate kinase type III